ncbi:hypothetical protein RDI58_024414 [Solanum bulbocastanum]
MADYF